jgi:hypothetical protein
VEKLKPLDAKLKEKDQEADQLMEENETFAVISKHE